MHPSRGMGTARALWSHYNDAAFKNLKKTVENHPKHSQGHFKYTLLIN